MLVWVKGWSLFEGLLKGLVDGENGFLLQSLYWGVSGIFWFVALLSILYLFVPLATIIASPFNDILSEKVEILMAGGQVESAFSIWDGLRSTTVGMITSLRLALKTWIILLCILPLHLIPAIGFALATCLSIFIGIRYLALEYTSYSMDRRCWNYGQRQSWLRRNRLRSMGLGAISLALMSIPLINAMFIPISAIAGTILFCETQSSCGSSRQPTNHK